MFHELGAEVISVGAEPDGLNINAGTGATHPQFLAEQMRAHGADLGIALDGDGDRLVMADRDGRTYDGDQLLYVIACDYQRRRVANGGVVGTLMSNLGFEQALARRDIPLARAKVGDRYVLEQMQAQGWLLGGENSGHIICLDKHTTGDAIVAALAVLRALIEQKQTLARGDGGSDDVPATADQRARPPRLGLARERDRAARRARRRRGAGRRRPRAAASVRHRARAARDGRGARRASRGPGGAVARGDDREGGGHPALTRPVARRRGAVHPGQLTTAAATRQRSGVGATTRRFFRTWPLAREGAGCRKHGIARRPAA